MSYVSDEIEKVREILKQYDDGELSAASCESFIHDVFLEPLLKTLEGGHEYMRFGSCCCSSHEPDRVFRVQFTIQPHGFIAKRCE